MHNTRSININHITIDILPGPVGISHSGGADSAILLYILMKELKCPIHVFTCSSSEKFRQAPYIALDVISKCMDLTGKKDVYHHSFFVDKQDSENLFEYQEKLWNLRLYRNLYTGLTSLPPVEVYDSFQNKIDNLIKVRNPEIKFKPVYRGRDNHIYSPFRNYNKKDIFHLYETLGLLESLFPLTRSCESLIQKTGHCGSCWWCEERKWAFGLL